MCLIFVRKRSPNLGSKLVDRGQIKKIATKKEKQVAKDLKIRRVPLSGGLIAWKGDLESKRYLIDCKWTVKPIYTLNGTDLAKITKEAREAGKEAGHLLLIFEPDYKWVCVPHIDVEFESTEEYIECKGSKQVSKTLLQSAAKRGIKKDKIPSILFFFEKICFGTPKKWLLIPYNTYKEIFHESE